MINLLARAGQIPEHDVLVVALEAEVLDREDDLVPLIGSIVGNASLLSCVSRVYGRARFYPIGRIFIAPRPC